MIIVERQPPPSFFAPQAAINVLKKLFMTSFYICKFDDGGVLIGYIKVS